MDENSSSGWEDVADQLIAYRSQVRLSTVLDWASGLPAGASIIDIGCGSGEPLSVALADMGFTLAGIDASPTLVEAYRQMLPAALVACEPAERSSFFGRKFDAAIAIGLIFLLKAAAQRQLIRNVAAALNPHGRFLFTAPVQTCTWPDLWTGRLSISLGTAEYSRVIEDAGMKVVSHLTDEGENHYYEIVKMP